MSIADPATLVDSLDPDQLRQQLEDLDRQQSALRVLLRAALARQRQASRPQLLACTEAADPEEQP